mgnify:CR=1 FL=1
MLNKRIAKYTRESIIGSKRKINCGQMIIIYTKENIAKQINKSVRPVKSYMLEMKQKH